MELQISELGLGGVSWSSGSLDRHIINILPIPTFNVPFNMMLVRWLKRFVSFRAKLIKATGVPMLATRNGIRFYKFLVWSAKYGPHCSKMMCFPVLCIVSLHLRETVKLIGLSVEYYFTQRKRVYFTTFVTFTICWMFRKDIINNDIIKLVSLKTWSFQQIYPTLNLFIHTWIIVWFMACITTQLLKDGDWQLHLQLSLYSFGYLDVIGLLVLRP